MIFLDTVEIIRKLFKSLLTKNQKALENKKKGSDFLFGYIDESRYSCHKISLNCDRSYIVSPGWVKKQKGKNKSYL